MTNQLYAQLHQLIVTLGTTRRLRFILNTAALKNRSAMEIALMDI